MTNGNIDAAPAIDPAGAAIVAEYERIIGDLSTRCASLNAIASSLRDKVAEQQRHIEAGEARTVTLEGELNDARRDLANLKRGERPPIAIAN